MRLPNDKMLANQVPEIDIILGGHDHHYITEFVKWSHFNFKHRCVYFLKTFNNFLLKTNEKWIIKSGCDFKDLSLIQIEKSVGEKPFVTKIERFTVDSKLEEDKELKVLLDSYLSNK